MAVAAIDHIIVVVPALDEVATIAATVTSILDALAHVNIAVTTDVVVAVDRLSADRTAGVARDALGSSGQVLEDTFGSVGAARRRATAHGLRRATADVDHTWIATTDADTTVPVAWLASQLELAAAGVVGIAGIVELYEAPMALADQFRAHYVTNADGSHAHVHGANLGIRADAYLRAGGWRDHATGEDHDLWRRLQAVGPVIHSTAVCVSTSARREGRAPDGFANDLATLDTSV